MKRKKYEFTGKTRRGFGRILHQIRALVPLPGVEAGACGGWIEGERNLSHDGDCWVFGDASVCDNAQVLDNALIYDAARVYGNAKVYDGAWVCDHAMVSGDAWVFGDARVFNYAWIGGDAWAYGDAEISGFAQLCNFARVRKSSHIWVSPPIGPKNTSITFYRSIDRKIMAVHAFSPDDIDAFAREAREMYGNSPSAKACEKAIRMAKIWIDLTEGGH